MSNVTGKSVKKTILNKTRPEALANKKKISAQTRVRDEIGPDGMWVIKTFTGYIVTFKELPDEDRPAHFESEGAKRMWDLEQEIKLRRKKLQIQMGQYVPENALLEVDLKPLCQTPSTKQFVERQSLKQRKAHVDYRNARKIHDAQLERQFVELMIQVRKSFCRQHPLDDRLRLLEQVSKFHVYPLMLTKHPFGVNIIHGLRKHTRTRSVMHLDAEMFTKEKQVESLANCIYRKFQLYFMVKKGTSFEQHFLNEVVSTWRSLDFNLNALERFINEPKTMFIRKK